MTDGEYAFGPSDPATLGAIRDVFVRHEPLVVEAAFDSALDPTTLAVDLAEGFAAAGRFDVRWSTRDFYSFHYTEPDLDFRFDYHPNPHSPPKHFHPPPDAATDAVPSCITVEQAERVTLAVCQCWRRGIERDDPAAVNAAEDPP